MTSLRSRCFAFTPRLGQIVCVFVIGLLVGHYVLRGRLELEGTTDSFSREGESTVDELDLSLADLESSVRNVQPNVDYDVNSQVFEARSPKGRAWSPEVPRADNATSSARLLLSQGLVTNVVHYLWCEVKIFEYQHYLSVRSVVTHINPQRVVFHYVQYPRHDDQLYNTWFEDMKKEFMYIDLVDRTADKDICSSPASQTQYITNVLKAQGGIYVHFNTVFLNFPLKYRRGAVTDGLTNDVEGFLVIQKGVTPTDANTDHKQCLPAQDYSDTNPATICAIKKGPYFPRDSWAGDDDFSRQVNLLMYGQPNRPRALPADHDVIPNIGHVLWLDGREMPFLFYLNCLSHLYILKVDRLYVHGNVEPSGAYWETVKKEERITFVKIVRPDLLFRKTIGVLPHMADAFRADVLLRYGGVYTDADAVWVRPIPPELRRYDVVASYDWPQRYNNFPDYINFGATLSRPGAPFWYYFLHNFKDLRDDKFGYNGLLKPYKIFERHPDLVHIYDRLQVVCWELRCHPTWYKDFRDKDADHRRYPDFDWRDTHLFHWTDPTPSELMNEVDLKNSDSFFAEIGKHILKAADRL